MSTPPVAARMADIAPFHAMAILARARQLEAEGRSIIHLEIGEPDFPTPQPIIDAGIAALRQGDLNYTPALGLAALRTRIAAYYSTHYGVTVMPIASWSRRVRQAHCCWRWARSPTRLMR